MKLNNAKDTAISVIRLEFKNNVQFIQNNIDNAVAKCQTQCILKDFIAPKSIIALLKSKGYTVTFIPEDSPKDTLISWEDLYIKLINDSAKINDIIFES